MELNLFLLITDLQKKKRKTIYSKSLFIISLLTEMMLFFSLLLMNGNISDQTLISEYLSLQNK